MPGPGIITAGDVLSQDPIGERFFEMATQGTVLPLADYSAGAPANREFSPGRAWAMTLVINIVSITGTSVQVFWEYFDRASQTWVAYTQTPPLGAGVVILKAGSAITFIANQAANQELMHENMRTRVVYTAVTQITMSIGAHPGP